MKFFNGFPISCLVYWFGTQMWKNYFNTSFIRPRFSTQMWMTYYFNIYFIRPRFGTEMWMTYYFNTYFIQPPLIRFNIFSLTLRGLLVMEMVPRSCGGIASTARAGEPWSWQLQKKKMQLSSSSSHFMLWRSWI
jgi:hypothetical protein